MYVCMHACMHACMHVCMYVCMYVRMYVCVCVYIYIYIYIHTYDIHRARRRRLHEFDSAPGPLSLSWAVRAPSFASRRAVAMRRAARVIVA